MPSTDFTPLSIRQRKYILGVSQGMTRTQALRFAQYSEATRPCAVENASVKAAFARLIRRTAPAHKIAKVIEEGLDATRTMVVIAGPKDSEGNQAPPQEHKVPDFKERREYAKLAADWGEYVDKDKSSVQANVAVGVTILNGVTRPKRGE